MKRIVWSYGWPEDVDRLVELFAGEGVLVTRLEAAVLWDCYSATYAAGWLDRVSGITGEQLMDCVRQTMSPMAEDNFWPVGFEEQGCWQCIVDVPGPKGAL